MSRSLDPHTDMSDAGVSFSNCHVGSLSVAGSSDEQATSKQANPTQARAMSQP
jgi:hypothetical protein